MNYHKFRDQWHKVLQTTLLSVPRPILPTEQINLRDMSRSYELILYGKPQPKCEPFFPTATIEWEWDALLSARFATTEEDMLMQIFGDFDIHEDSVPPTVENGCASVCRRELRNCLSHASAGSSVPARRYRISCQLVLTVMDRYALSANL